MRRRSRYLTSTSIPTSYDLGPTCSRGSPSDDGGRANAVFTPLLPSCRMLALEPWAYLRELLCLLPGWSSNRLLELAPVNWTCARDLTDVRDRLAANPYRALTILHASSAAG